MIFPFENFEQNADHEEPVTSYTSQMDSSDSKEIVPLLNSTEIELNNNLTINGSYSQIPMVYEIELFEEIINRNNNKPKVTSTYNVPSEAKIDVNSMKKNLINAVDNIEICAGILKNSDNNCDDVEYVYEEDNNDDIIKDEDYRPSGDEDESEDEYNQEEVDELHDSKNNRTKESNTDSSAEISTSFSNSFFTRISKSVIPEEKLQVEESRGPKGQGKYHFCIFCKKLQSQIARHLLTVHKNEEEVKKFSCMPVKNEERLSLIARLRKKGDFLFNTSEDYNSSGKMITVRRARVKKDLEGHVYSTRATSDFVNCPNCRGFYSITYLRHHFPKCNGSKILTARTLLQESARKLCRVHPDAGRKMRKRIIPVLTKGTVLTNTIKYDRLIILFGNLQCLRYKEEHLDEMIRSKLRLLGKLVIAAKEINSSIVDLASLYHPSHFKTVLESALKVSKYNQKTERLESPSNATNIGTLIKKCSQILECEYLALEKPEERKSVKDFMKVFDTMYGAHINIMVAESEKEIKRKKLIELPSTSDVKLFLGYLARLRDGYFDSLTAKFSSANWRNLLEVVLAYLITFNRRRRGEMQRLSVADFKSMIIFDKNETYVGLTQEDKDMADEFHYVLIRGKKMNSVSVLTDKKTFECMELLYSLRVTAGINDKNKFFFGLPGANLSKTLEGCALMRKFSTECGAENPKLLRGTELRKQFATKVANMEISEHARKNVQKHLGHSQPIHEQIYIQPSALTSVCQVTKALINSQKIVSESQEQNIIEKGLSQFYV